LNPNIIAAINAATTNAEDRNNISSNIYDHHDLILDGIFGNSNNTIIKYESKIVITAAIKPNVTFDNIITKAPAVYENIKIGSPNITNVLVVMTTTP
jgi:hypothetical protein